MNECVDMWMDRWTGGRVDGWVMDGWGSLGSWVFTSHVSFKISVSEFPYLCIFSCVPSLPYFYSSTSDQWVSNDAKTNLCCWHIECSTFTASSFRIWNSSTGIPSPPLALLLVMLPKAHLTSHLKHKLESRLLEEVSKTSDMQMTPPLWQKVKRSWRAS